MSKRNDGGPAFPVGSDLGPASNICDGGYGGMSLRDYFAAAAMPGIIADAPSDHTWATEVARQAYLIADAMLRERDKT